MILSKKIYEPYMSEYINRIYNHDYERLELMEVEVGDRFIKGTFDVALTYQDPFHLSDTQVQQWVDQLFIIYGCWDNKLERKMGETWNREYHMLFKKPILQTKGIIMLLKFENKRTVGDHVMYQCSMDICDGSFEGYATGLLGIR